MNDVTFRHQYPLALVWAVLLATALYARPLLPVDETRYLAVAWEMWHRGDFLVPYLNGEPYSHKPPLLFWGMHLGWAVFGVNEWWPRLVAPLFGLAAVLLTMRLGRLLWPSDSAVGPTAAWITLGAVFWTVFTTMTMFDMMLACFTVMGMIGLVIAWRGEALKGFGLFAIAIGLGALAKGPAILVHLLPVALLAPLWARHMDGGMTWRRWYAGVMIGLLVGAGLGLAWAVPAANAGGDAYREAIFWGQSAGRMVKSFAHDRPFWWYAAILPIMVLPWAIWPPAWRAMRRRRAAMLQDGGVRLCLLWIGLSFLVFSAISGKQPHYLLPEFPAMALVLAWALRAGPEQLDTVQSIDRWVPAVLFLGLAALLAGAAMLHLRPSWATSAGDIWAWPAVILITSIAIGVRVYRNSSVAVLAGISAAAVVTVHLALQPLVVESHNFRPLALKMKTWEDAGYSFVTFGKYRGEFHFLGRLTKPIAIVDGSINLAKHLAGRDKVKVFRTEKTIPPNAQPDAVQKFRGRSIVVWDAARLPEYFFGK